MNMEDFMPHWLNAAELQRLGGRYEGIVARVVAERVRNPYKKEDDPKVEPVIEFTDGYRLVPNIAMRRSLMRQFGADTDAWVGARLVLVCLRGKDRIDKETGVVKETWTKHLQFPDDHPAAADLAAGFVTRQGESGDSDSIGLHGEDDDVAAVRPFTRRG